jgi:hypothetical protein
MSIEPKPASRAKKPSATAAPTEAPRQRLRREDPVAFARWHKRLSDQLDDVIAVAYDATSPLTDRRLSRVYARQLLEEAESALEELLALAEPPQDNP